MEQSEVEIFTTIILMEVKTQEQVLKLFSACVVIISIQRNEQNRRFKHYIPYKSAAFCHRQTNGTPW